MNKDNKNKKIGIAAVHILFVMYLFVLFRITVFRSGVSFDNLMENGKLNLTLFQSYKPLITAGDWWRIIYLLIGNLIWFVPLGMYLKWLGKVNKTWKIVLAGLMLSMIIECLQYLFGTGISELDDLILNSLGTWCGAGIFKGISLFYNP